MEKQISNLFEEESKKSGALFSECGKYRYVLWRIWDDTKPLVMFIGLNPSTANQTEDDPTIRRVKKFAKDWGYGGVYMTNLFSLVSPDPRKLRECADPVADNDMFLEFASISCKEIVFAWGKFKEAKDRSEKVIKMFPEAKALVINNDGTPRHPLYVKGDVVPQKYSTNQSS